MHLRRKYFEFNQWISVYNESDKISTAFFHSRFIVLLTLALKRITFISIPYPVYRKAFKKTIKLRMFERFQNWEKLMFMELWSLLLIARWMHIIGAIGIFDVWKQWKQESRLSNEQRPFTYIEDTKKPVLLTNIQNALVPYSIVPLHNHISFSYNTQKLSSLSARIVRC